MAGRTAKAKPMTKVCLKCNRATPLVNYYVNSSNRDGLFKDNWCKDCYIKTVKNKESAQEYFKFNNRVWKEELWNWANQKASESLNSSDEYLKIKDPEKQQEMFIASVIKNIAQQMNQTQHYQFIPFTAHEAQIKKVEKEIKTSKGKIEDINDEDAERIYNSKWGGSFTEAEIEYLDGYLNGLQADFEINNVNHVDYAKKVCKASLMVDKHFNDYINGIPGADKRWKDAQTAFNSLSEAAKFSEKTRSENDNTGMGSLGEITKKLETSGFLQKKMKFEKDEIDKIHEDFRWTLASVGEEI